MKYLSIFSLAMALTFSTFASVVTCRSSLTEELRLDSKHFVVNLDELEITAPVTDKMGQAVQMIRSIVAKEGCTRSDISFGQGPEGSAQSKCSMINPARTNSLACYVESNLGYFNVTWDMGHHAHVTFNLWD